ncbi:MAG: hypothetical protein ACI9EW_002980 [Cellvibrionaceae bacterium]|jgi:hypothetical protein
MKNLIGFIIFLIIVAFLFRVDFVFYIIYVCIGLYAWSYWGIPRRLKKVELNRVFQDHAFWGEPLEVSIKVENSGAMAVPWLEISDSVAVQLSAGRPINTVIPLKGKEVVHYSYPLNTNRRGYYRIGPTQIRSGDMFGFTQPKTFFLPADFLTIYPRITPIERLKIASRLPFGTIISNQRLFEDPARPTGVRDFRSGDSMRQINWKVSAHTQNLAVKTLQPAIYLESMIVLNLFKDDFAHWDKSTTIEWAIELAASLAAHLHKKRQPIGLASNGVDPLQTEAGAEIMFDQTSGRLLRQSEAEIKSLYSLPPNNSRAHLMKILERLARIETADVAPFNGWLQTNSLPLGWGGTALVVTPSADAALCQTLHHWVKRGINPILIQVEKSSNFRHIKERARRLGFTAVEVLDPAQIDQAFSGGISS